MWTSWVLLSLVLILGVVAIAVFVWAVRFGVFSDAEDVKYLVLRAEEDDLAPPDPLPQMPGTKERNQRHVP
ncbi:MAG: cbb3-type cytochrome oxidase assembly protein [Armatimonadetes bacterium]|nr:cbb3-type cytochrome oxidase assembly protein [Armatimonadota bacterium]